MGLLTEQELLALDSNRQGERLVEAKIVDLNWEYNGGDSNSEAYLIGSSGDEIAISKINLKKLLDQKAFRVKVSLVLEGGSEQSLGTVEIGNGGDVKKLEALLKSKNIKMPTETLKDAFFTMYDWYEDYTDHR